MGDVAISLFITFPLYTTENRWDEKNRVTTAAPDNRARRFSFRHNVCSYFFLWLFYYLRLMMVVVVVAVIVIIQYLNVHQEKEKCEKKD